MISNEQARTSLIINVAMRMYADVSSSVRGDTKDMLGNQTMYRIIVCRCNSLPWTRTNEYIPRSSVVCTWKQFEITLPKWRHKVTQMYSNNVSIILDVSEVVEKFNTLRFKHKIKRILISVYHHVICHRLGAKVIF